MEPTESEGNKHQDTFVIRNAKCLDDLQWVVKLAAEQGFAPRKKEAECYFSAGLTPCFYIGEVNGKRIGCICRVKHREEVVYGGYELVAKPYRGRGYGLKLFEFVEALGDKSDIQMVVVTKLKDYLAERGYHPGWILKVYQFTASLAMEGLASCQLPPSVAQILPASHADFEKLFAYSADMLGTSQVCKLLLAAWLAHLQKSSWVAFDNKDNIVGYLIMSDTIPEGYSIAPFFADSAPIARSLLKVAITFANANNPRHNIEMITPGDHNPEGVSILERDIGAKAIEECTFMSGKELPIPKHLSKVFGVAGTSVV